MDWTDWYTDTADVFRNEKVTENSLTHMERRQVLSGVACRVYQTKPSGLQMNQTAASITQTPISWPAASKWISSPEMSW